MSYVMLSEMKQSHKNEKYYFFSLLYCHVAALPAMIENGSIYCFSLRFIQIVYDGEENSEMKVIGDSLSFSTGGFNDMKDLTGEVSRKLSENKLYDLTMSFVLDPSFIPQGIDWICQGGFYGLIAYR